MVKQHITPDDSFSYATGGYYTIDGVGSGSNSVVIDPGTLMFTTGTGDDAGIPLYLQGIGQWTATIGGSLWSTDWFGLFMEPHSSGSKASTVTVTAEGSIFGQYAGIAVGDFYQDTVYRDTPITIKIAGEVGASSGGDVQGIAIYFNTTASHTVTNTGKVYGYWGLVSEGTAADTITNSGEMDWVSAGAGTNKMVNTYELRGYFGGWGTDSFENNGSNAYVGADVELGDGTNTLKNSGTINDYDIGQVGVLGGDDSDTVTNSGTIVGGVNLSSGSNTVSSTAGWIGATDDVSYIGYDGNDTITNGAASRFDGAVHVGNGTNKLTNAGFIGADADGYSYNSGFSINQPSSPYNNDTVANNGAAATLDGGVQLGDGTNSLTNSGSIGAVGGISVEGGAQNDSVTNSGILLGGVKLGDGANSLTNSKEIDGEVLGGTGIDTFTNKSGGTVGNVNLGAGNNKVSNSGIIATLTLGNGADTVTNESSGHIASLILGGAALGNTVDTLTNKGTIGVDGSTSIFGDAAGDTITNSGTILGEISLGGGTNKLTNTGAIGENQTVAILGGLGSDTITSSKAILGGIDLGDGVNKLTNSGAIGEDTNHLSYSGGADVDTVVNSGTLIGDVWLAGGNDSFTDSSGKTQGTVHGIIDLGAGADKFVGGNNAETVVDNDGADSYALGGGNDYFIAVHAPNAGVDTIDGGAGDDMYDATGATEGVLINLSTSVQVDNFHAGSPTTLAAGMAVGFDIGTDFVKAVEDAVGGSSNDIIIGTDGASAANYIFGGDGDDDLAGLGGSDTLVGGDGNDGLLGGAGRDILTGGDGNTLDGLTDYFVYTSVSESGVTASTRDLITDFEMGIDKIDLHLIDANTRDGLTLDHDPGFTFIGINAIFNHVAGELRAYWTVSGQIVEGDTNGDGRADFSIQVSDVHGGDAFQSSDFIL